MKKFITLAILASAALFLGACAHKDCCHKTCSAKSVCGSCTHY